MPHVSGLPIVAFCTTKRKTQLALYLEERSDVDVIPEVRKSAGDYLPPSVVPVLSHFRNLYFAFNMSGASSERKQTQKF